MGLYDWVLNWWIKLVDQIFFLCQILKLVVSSDSPLPRLSSVSNIDTNYKSTTLPIDLSKRLLKNKNNKKAPGDDKINNTFLKHLSKKRNSLKVSNACITIGYFPSTWKIGKVIAIPKQKKLISSLCKLFESPFLAQIDRHNSRNNILSDFQLRFRKHTSTVHQMFTRKITSNTT